MIKSHRMQTCIFVELQVYSEQPTDRNDTNRNETTFCAQQQNQKKNGKL